MKRLHRPDLYAWSCFDEVRDIDFNSYVWARPGGGVVIDPLPMSGHDLAHLRGLGGAQWVVITNGDHVRDAVALAAGLGASLAGPAGERDTLGVACERWLADGDELVPGLQALALSGSKTPGELALVLEETTLITGDLVRSHAAGALHRLPDPKLSDRAAATASVGRLARLDRIEAVLVGDGWPVFRDGHARLRELAAQLAASAADHA